jgi:hypothetical protein
MNVRRISRTAIKQIYLELNQLEQRALAEIKKRQTRPLGIVRLDLIEECRRRLEFLDLMVKDAAERHRQEMHSHAQRGIA